VVEKCANPECSKPFDFRQGRLYCCPMPAVDGCPPANGHGLEHHWLCGLCSESYTFEGRAGFGTVITPRSMAPTRRPSLVGGSGLRDRQGKHVSCAHVISRGRSTPQGLL
jgi:hypothetical protein